MQQTSNCPGNNDPAKNKKSKWFITKRVGSIFSRVLNTMSKRSTPDPPPNNSEVGDVSGRSNLADSKIWKRNESDETTTVDDKKSYRLVTFLKNEKDEEMKAASTEQKASNKRPTSKAVSLSRFLYKKSLSFNCMRGKIIKIEINGNIRNGTSFNSTKTSLRINSQNSSGSVSKIAGKMYGRQGSKHSSLRRNIGSRRKSRREGFDDCKSLHYVESQGSLEWEDKSSSGIGSLRSLEQEDKSSCSRSSNAELCKKRILMGGKCRPLNHSGILEYDNDGILLPDIIP